MNWLRGVEGLVERPKWDSKSLSSCVRKLGTVLRRPGRGGRRKAAVLRAMRSGAGPGGGVMQGPACRAARTAPNADEIAELGH